MSASELVRLTVSLAVLLGGLLIVRHWSRGGRSGRRVSGSGRVPIRIAGRAGIARGAHVAVVEVDGQRFLVGAGEHGVSLLAELPSTADAGAGRDTVDLAELEGDDFTADRTPDPLMDPSVSIQPRMGLVARLQRSTLRTAGTSRPRAPHR
jgi:flagellar biogenesis protein FliO